ncbi:hypothetical protein Tco_1568090 [Tanacetum coccineum]
MLFLITITTNDIRQSDLYSEHAYWKATLVPPLDPSPSSTTNKVEVPKELPKVSMVNTSLKELKRHLAGFDQAVEQHRLESRTFKVKMNQVLSENERLLAQAIDHDIVKTVVNLSVNDGCETVNECQKCLELKTELLNKKDVVDKETYDKLCCPNRPLVFGLQCSKHMTEDRSQLTNFISKFLGLGHNLFSMGEFCDSNLEVAFRQHTCFIRNLEGVDLLTGSRGDNLYTLSLGNMMASSPFVYCLNGLRKPSLGIWHCRLSH